MLYVLINAHWNGYAKFRVLLTQQETDMYPRLSVPMPMHVVSQTHEIRENELNCLVACSSNYLPST